MCGNTDSVSVTESVHLDQPAELTTLVSFAGTLVLRIRQKGPIQLCGFSLQSTQKQPGWLHTISSTCGTYSRQQAFFFLQMILLENALRKVSQMKCYSTPKFSSHLKHMTGHQNDKAQDVPDHILGRRSFHKNILRKKQNTNDPVSDLKGQQAVNLNKFMNAPGCVPF